MANHGEAGRGSVGNLLITMQPMQTTYSGHATVAFLYVQHTVRDKVRESHGGFPIEVSLHLKLNARRP